MKQKYVIPNIELTELEFKYCILAGSGDPNGEQGLGGGNDPSKPKPPGGVEGGITGGDGDGLAKDHNFNAWETWDEY